MKSIFAIVVLLLHVGVSFTLQGPAPEVERLSDRSELSPAQRAIVAAKAKIEAAPSNPAGYSDWGLALTRLARETSDHKYYLQAEEAVQQALKLQPDYYPARKVAVWALLGKHEFKQALEAATTLNRLVPDDVIVHGYLADAHAELGNYDDAEKAVQWMLDLRPANVPGLTRASYLREIFGDIDGAVELMQMAYGSVGQTEREDRAWILNQLAHLNILKGNIEGADRLLQQALNLFPNYHYALKSLGKVRLIQKRYEDAVTSYHNLYKVAPHPENLYELAVALKMSGRTAESERAFADFERDARSESVNADNANHELVFYYIDHAGKPAEGLKIAELEFNRRKDIYTLDAYAWALHASGRHQEARTQLNAALKQGTRSPLMLYHAGAIAFKLDLMKEAQQFWTESAGKGSEGSDLARAALLQFPK